MTQPLRPGGEPETARATKGDVRFFVTTLVAILVAGLSIGAILWVLSGRGGDPTGRRAEYTAFSAGNAETLTRQIREGGPVFFADPLAGEKGFWIDREQDELVALSVNAPGEDECAVRWRASVNRYEDCDGTRYTSEQLARFTTNIPQRGKQAGLFLVDLRRITPAPEPPPQQPPLG
ncbi:MAG: hypothetical protein ACKO72_00960 [Actinomycetes bacterium]